MHFRVHRRSVARGRRRTTSSNGALNEAGAGRGLGSPLRCQRVYVKFALAKCGSGGWPGPHYFFLFFDSAFPLGFCHAFLARLQPAPQKDSFLDIRFLFALNFLHVTARRHLFVAARRAESESPARQCRVNRTNRTSPEGTAHFQMSVSIALTCNRESAKNNFGLVFENICRSSTTAVRVISPSRWFKTLPKNTGTT